MHAPVDAIRRSELVEFAELNEGEAQAVETIVESLLLPGYELDVGSCEEAAEFIIAEARIIPEEHLLKYIFLLRVGVEKPLDLLADLPEAEHSPPLVVAERRSDVFLTFGDDHFSCLEREVPGLPSILHEVGLLLGVVRKVDLEPVEEFRVADDEIVDFFVHH